MCRWRYRSLQAPKKTEGQRTRCRPSRARRFPSEVGDTPVEQFGGFAVEEVLAHREPSSLAQGGVTIWLSS